MAAYCEKPECVGDRVHTKGNCPRTRKQKQAKHDRMARKMGPTPGTERCGQCSARVKVVVRNGVVAGFERHKMPSSHLWCPNGTQRVPRVKEKRSHRGKSVRAVGGGLPTLGKH